MTVVVENEIQVSGSGNRRWLSNADYGAEKAYESRAGDMVFGVGYLTGLQQGALGLQVFEDKRSRPDFRTGPLWGFYPDAYQDAMLAGLGVAEAVLIGQDIQVGLEVIRRRRTTALVLTGSSDITDQWIAGLDTALQIEPGRITDGLCCPDSITIATVDAVCSRLSGEIEGRRPWDVIGCDPGLVIVDGCDRVPIEKLRKAVRAFRPSFRCGFVHKDITGRVEMMLICHELGPVVYNRSWGMDVFDHPSMFDWRLNS